MGSKIPDIGDMAPDFKVLTASEEQFQLKAALKNTHNIMLIFYRGHWWPFCIRQLAEIKKQYADIIKYKTRAFALSVDSPKQSRAIVSEMMLPFDLLCDVDKKVIQLYDLVNPFEHGGIARPAIFIINPDGKICYRSVDGTAHRVDLTHVLNFLKAHYGNPDLDNKEPVDKKWIIPSWKTTGQIMKNMILRGTLADWKHYCLFPLSPIIIPLKKLKQKAKKKDKSNDQA